MKTTRKSSVVHRRLAKAIHNQAQAKVQAHMPTRIGTVIDLDPFRVELHETNDVLQVGLDLMVSQWVRRYDSEYGIEVEDNAIIVFVHGHFVWTDVLADTDVS